MAQLDRDQIAAAALAVIDANGVAGFTIRAIADSMGVTPMALYYYVKDKADMARLVVSAAIRERPLSPLTGDWREDMLTFARWSRVNASSHSAVGELHRIYPVYTPEIVEMAERWLYLWRQSGLDRKSAVLAATASSIAIVGFAAEAAAFRNLKPPGEDLVARTAEVRKTFGAEDTDALFDLTVRSLINGLHATLKKPSSTRPRVRRELKKRNRKGG